MAKKRNNNKRTLGFYTTKIDEIKFEFRRSKEDIENEIGNIVNS